MTTERSVLMIESAALNYSAVVQAGSVEPESMHDAYCGAVEHLHHMALEYAAAQGNLDAGERAELLSLRRFRDGMIALRGEVVQGCEVDGRVIDDIGIHVVGTIDAVLTMSGVEP